MRIAYLDCFAGISGDMFLGALIDAGVPLAVLQDATRALKLGASLKVEKVDRSGISSVKVHVLEGERLADGGLPEDGAGRHGSFEHQGAQATHSHLPKTQHLHKTGHAHDHPHTHAHEEESHQHTHGRSLTVIRALIESADLAEPVKRTAVRAFELLGGSESKIHNVPIEQIHFHEVGAVDAIVDIVAASAGIHHLQIGAWYSSPVNVGGGMVQCAHGLFPVPAPATADLLRGFPTYSAHVQKELVTPTGAALLRALAPEFGPQPAMVVEQIGYGAGTRNPADFPNVLRLVVGASSESHDLETVSVIETALDDLSPQVIAYTAEQALAAGALDVMLTPVVMKKGRPGTLLTVLSAPAKTDELAALILRETSTLGLRIRHERRMCLERRHVPVATDYGEIRIKIGFFGEDELNAAPEFEDCKAAALEHGVALKQVQAAAVAAYRGAYRAMTPQALLAILSEVEQGKVSPETAAAELSKLPYEDLGHARVDHHRSLRTGLPEVIYAAGKTTEQTVAIFNSLLKDGVDVLATRVDAETAAELQRVFPGVTHNAVAHTVAHRAAGSARQELGHVAVVCAGTSDLPVAEEAAITAETFGAKVTRFYDVGVAGLHRILSVRETMTQADVVIVCAGMEGALPSVVGGLVGVPVIAVPTSVGYGASFGGATALLGMLNSCSPNVVVVNIDNGFGAAYTAVLIARQRAHPLPAT